MSAPRRSILIVHQNFPGQFPHVAKALAARGDRVAAIGSPTARGLPGVDLRRWTNPTSSTPGIFPAAVRAEADLIRADATLRAAVTLAADGFAPDVIVANPGWGETLHLKEIWPNARLILLVEYWYNSRGGDVGFDPEFGPAILPPAQAAALNARNLGQALACTLADRIVCPTPFQASMFPPAIRERITVHHEGIDVARAGRVAPKRIRLADGAVLDGTRPLVTFIARTLEPLRGFHSFMRALPRVMAAHPTAEVVVIGSADEQGYGLAPPAGQSWKSALLAEQAAGLDLSRLHFTGRVAHGEMMALLSLSTAHVYLTYPFTQSWSLLEAMACGCLVIGSDTAPVRDVIRDGDTGLLVDFFAPDAIADAIGHAITDPARFAPLRARAAALIRDAFDAATVGVPGWLGIIDAV